MPLRYVGCYINPDGISNRTTISGMTIQSCAEYCHGLSFDYFALNNGDQCGCGNTAQPGDNSQDCVTPCDGDADQICGGTSVWSVYTTKSTVTHNECTHADRDGDGVKEERAWCAVTSDYKMDGRWGYCHEEQRTYADVTSSDAVAVREYGDQPSCYFPFKYDGIMYHECTNVDHGTRWCFLQHMGEITNDWAECLPNPECPPMYLITFPYLQACPDGHYVVITAQEDVTYTLYSARYDETIIRSLSEGESDVYKYAQSSNAINVVTTSGDRVSIMVDGKINVHVNDDCRLWTSDFKAYIVYEDFTEYYYPVSLAGNHNKLIIAREDNTYIKLQLGSGLTYEFVLDKYEFYDRRTAFDGVVCIKATKPVSVISSYICSRLSQATCDGATAQALPVSRWTTRYWGPKFDENIDTQYTVVSATNGNNVNIVQAGTAPTNVVINKFEKYEYAITQEAVDIECSEPCYVETVINRPKHLTLLETSMEFLPTEMFTSDVEDNFYFSTEYPKATSSGGIIYNETYVTLVAPVATVSTLMLDGNQVSDMTTWYDFPNAGYQYATVVVGKGIHTITWVGSFTGFVYGPGQGDLEGTFRIIS